MHVLDKVTYGIIEKEFAKIKTRHTLNIRVIQNPRYQILSMTMLEFIEQIAHASNNKIHVKKASSFNEYPHIAIDKNIEYYGVPTGYQTGMFTHLLLDLVKNELLTDAKIITSLKKIKKDVQVCVYISPSCQISPIATRWAIEFATINKKIYLKVFDCVQFPDVGLKNQITSTPTITINNKLKIVGTPTPEELLQKIKLATS